MAMVLEQSIMSKRWHERQLATERADKWKSLRFGEHSFHSKRISLKMLNRHLKLVPSIKCRHYKLSAYFPAHFSFRILMKNSFLFLTKFNTPESFIRWLRMMHTAILSLGVKWLRKSPWALLCIAPAFTGPVRKPFLLTRMKRGGRKTENSIKTKINKNYWLVLKLTKIYKQNVISHIKIINLKFIWLNGLL